MEKNEYCGCPACNQRHKLHNTLNQIFNEYKEEFDKKGEILEVKTVFCEILQWAILQLKNGEYKKEEVLKIVKENSLSIIENLYEGEK